jgi:transcription antitermination factor NusG
MDPVLYLARGGLLQMAQEWFAARINSAPLAIAALRRQGFQSFYPTRPTRHFTPRKVVIIDRPVFVRYIFILFDVAAGFWHPIKGTYGVSYLLPKHAEEPQPMPRGFVDAVKASLAEPEEKTAEVVRLFERDALVRIIGGSMIGYTGRVVSSRRRITRVRLDETFAGHKGVVAKVY